MALLLIGKHFFIKKFQTSLVLLNQLINYYYENKTITYMNTKLIYNYLIIKSETINFI